MKKDILLAIAKATREIPDRQFDMGVWKSTRFAFPDCETVFCSIGNAIEKGLIPELTWSPSGLPMLTEAEMLDYGQPRGMDLGFCDIAQAMLDLGFGGIAQAIGITPGEAIELFSSSSYQEEDSRYKKVTQEMVARKIEEFVNQGEGESDA